MNKNQQQKLEQALLKGEEFYGKKNFPLANRYFDTVIRLNPQLVNSDKIFAEKIKICQQQVSLQLRKDTIKKARNYEKKAKLSLSLEHYQKAALMLSEEVEQEQWLATKISELKKKLFYSQLSTQLSQAQDLESQLLAYQKLLAIDPDNLQISNKLAQCYVKEKLYSDAIALFLKSENTATFTDMDAYYFGYAYLQLDNLIDGLFQWSRISPLNKQAKTVFEQWMQLLPAAMEKIIRVKPQQIVTILKSYYEFLCYFQHKPEYKASIQSLYSLYVNQLWLQQQYEKIHHLVYPFNTDAITLEQLVLYAKLYFRLASEHENIQYLQYAISFYLSAIYNEKILHTLFAFQKADEQTDLAKFQEELQQQLLSQLESLVDDYKQRHQLTHHVIELWEKEKQIVQLLHKLANKSKTFKRNLKNNFFVCSPVFAQLFNLNDAIYQIIVSNKKYLMGKNNNLDEEQFLELCCYFSPLADSMLQAINGDELNALKGIAKISHMHSLEAELINYCQEKIAFQYAFRLLSEEPVKSEKYFIKAMPLIKKYPEYSQKLINFVFSYQVDLKVYSSMANTMEILSKQIKDTKFYQATAYTIAMKVKYMNFSGSFSTQQVDKLLEKALSFDPDCHIAKEFQQENTAEVYAEQFHKAFSKGNCYQAAKIVRQSNDEELKDVFFDIIKSWVVDIVLLSRNEKIMELERFYQHCRYVDKQHPVTINIGEEIEREKS